MNPEKCCAGHGRNPNFLSRVTYSTKHGSMTKEEAYRVRAGRLKDADHIGADQLPLKRRLQREFTNTAKEIALDKAPNHIKRQMAEL